jgi:hypothetical protein
VNQLGFADDQLMGPAQMGTGGEASEFMPHHSAAQNSFQPDAPDLKSLLARPIGGLFIIAASARPAAPAPPPATPPHRRLLR